MKGIQRLIFISGVVLIIVVALIVLLRKKDEIYYARQGDVVELRFELDKKFEFGKYYFDINNGKGYTYPLCFCLTEKNTYPADCSGDVKYLYNNTPGTMCIPLKIGNGRCSVAPIKTLGYATSIIIPLEYPWTKPFEKIVLGIRVPAQAPEAARLVVAVTILKQDDSGKMQRYRLYEKTIIVKQTKDN